MSRSRELLGRQIKDYAWDDYDDDDDDGQALALALGFGLVLPLLCCCFCGLCCCRGRLKKLLKPKQKVDETEEEVQVREEEEHEEIEQARKKALISGENYEEADIMESLQAHSSIGYSELVAIVQETGDTLFPFEEKVVVDIFRLIDYSGDGIISVSPAKNACDSSVMAIFLRRLRCCFLDQLMPTLPLSSHGSAHCMLS